MAQVIQHLHCKREALSSNSSCTKNDNKKVKTFHKHHLKGYFVTLLLKTFPTSKSNFHPLHEE
jgi:hypothetical protein